VTAEEFLAIENPYRGMLDEPSLRASPQRQQFRPRINLNEDNTIQQRLTNDGFEEIALTTPGTEQVLSRSGIKITVNDESDDIVDAQWMDDSSKWVGLLTVSAYCKDNADLLIAATTIKDVSDFFSILW